MGKNPVLLEELLLQISIEEGKSTTRPTGVGERGSTSLPKKMK